MALAATFGAVVFAARPAPLVPSEVPSSMTGRGAVIDGDTIEIGARRIRLYGIEAPARAQSCRDGRGQDYACGRMAADALAVRIGRRTLACEPRAADGADSVVAVCRLGGDDVAEWLVRQGWAVAAHRFGGEYARAESGARTERLGIWAGAFTLLEERPPAR